MASQIRRSEPIIQRAIAISQVAQELFVMANRMAAGLELCDSFSLLSNNTLGRRNMSRGSRQFTY
jgi:hypothetical protein